MGVYSKAIRNSNGINYTKEVDSSVDYSGITNNTYFKDLSDGLIYWKNGGGTVIGLFEAGGASGKLAIYSSGGTPTYYSDWTSVMSAATSGDVIVQLANITETSNVEIAVKAGVIIDMGKYTYTLNTSGTTSAFKITTAGTFKGRYNVKRLGSTSTSGHQNLCMSIELGVDGTNNIYDFEGSNFEGYRSMRIQNGSYNSGTIIDAGTHTSTGYIAVEANTVTIHKIKVYSTAVDGTNPEYAACIYGNFATIENAVVKQTGTGCGIYLYSNSTLRNSSAFSNLKKGIDAGGATLVEFCNSKSNSDNGIYSVSITRKCVAESNGTHGHYQFQGRSEDCTGISSGGVGFFSYQATDVNCSGISTGSSGHYSRDGNSINPKGYSTVAYGGINYRSKVTKGDYLATSSVAASSTSSPDILTEWIDCTFTTTWNSANGHAYESFGNLEELVNCTFVVANTSAYGIYAASAVTIKFAPYVGKGMTTFNHTNVTQGQVNTQNNFGGILIG